MKKFLVLYQMPYAGLEEWKKQDASKRDAEEKRMQDAWQKWNVEHNKAILETAGAGQTVKIMKDGAKDAHNDIMLYSLVAAESKEEVTHIFEHHPHLEIPGSTIEIMEANVLPGMGK